MADFEIEVNGELLPTMKGELGATVISIGAIRDRLPNGTIYQPIILLRRFLPKGSQGPECPDWPNIQLRTGDEVRIRIVES